MSANSTEDMCSFGQLELKLFTSVFLTPTDTAVYITLATIHILFIVLPSLVLNTLAIRLLYKTNKDGHPSITVYYWICTLSIIAPCTYGLLMDLSLLSNQPFLGNCLIQWQGAMFLFAHSFFHTSLDWLLVVLSIVFYVTIFGKRRIQRWKLNLALVCILVFMILETFAFIGGIETYSNQYCHIRGSFCLIFYSEPTTVLFVGFARVLVALGIPCILVVILMVLSFVKIKKCTLGKSKQLVRSVMRLILCMLTAIFLFTIPTALLYFGGYRGFHHGFIELTAIYFVQVNFVLFPTLILILHKQARRKIINSLFGERGARRVQPDQCPINLDKPASCSIDLPPTRYLEVRTSSRAESRSTHELTVCAESDSRSTQTSDLMVNKDMPTWPQSQALQTCDLPQTPICKATLPLMRARKVGASTAVKSVTTVSPAKSASQGKTESEKDSIAEMTTIPSPTPSALSVGKDASSEIESPAKPEIASGTVPQEE